MTDQTTTLVIDGNDESYEIDGTIETPGTMVAIDASGALTGRSVTINGTVGSEAGTAMLLGDAALADSMSFVKVGLGGTLKSGGKGLVAASGGVIFNNVGNVQTTSTSVEFDGDGNVFENDAQMSSLAGMVLSSVGNRDNIRNTGNAMITAALDTIVSHGDRTTITNSGTAAITSKGGSAILATGKLVTIYNTSSINAEQDAVVASGGNATITNDGGGSVTSSHGAGFVLRGDRSTMINNATVSTSGDGIFSTGARTVITNNATITSWSGAAIRSTGDDAVITNATTLGGRTAGIVSTGDHATITNNGGITAGGTGIMIVGDHATVITSAHLTAKSALSISGDGARITIENEIDGTGKHQAAIEISASGDTTVVNRGAVNASASGAAIEAGRGAEHIVNTGSLNGSVTLGAGNDVFSSLKGQVTGRVYGGAGNDTYIVGISLDIRETAGGGIDTVQSKFTWTLAANVENLELLGRGRMEATGNGRANHIEGNAGNNHLTGLGGKDVFVFETGCRRDIVTDFTDGKDRLDLSGYEGVEKFSDLHGKIAQSGDDVMITLEGHDRLTIEHTHRSEFSAADFIF
jgi:hypothetical protein